MSFRSSALFRCLLTDVGSVLDAYQMGEILSGNSSIWPDATPKQVAAQRLIASIDKKFIDSIAEDAEAKALEEFLRVNAACKEWCLELNSSGDEELFGTFKRVLDDFFHPGGDLLFSSFEDLFDQAKMGPGASLGARGNDFYTKLFSSRLTATSVELYEMYRRHVTKHRDWEDAEILRSAIYGAVDVVEGNRVSFALKSNEISRTICTEPSLNMFYQLGLGEILSARLRTFFGIVLALQQMRNRELARLGSLLAGLMSTIDLTSASNSIARRMLAESLPGWFLDVLNLLRCGKSKLPDKLGGEWVDLNMISTMGNGFTFTLQCVIFAAVVRASFEVAGLPQFCEAGDATVKNWGVNGDDIVVPKGITRNVLRLLTLLGFTVNASKTFVEGPFRESCGGDYYKGHDVRGVFLKSLASPQSRYIAINLLNSWSYKTGIRLPCTIQYLLSTTKYQPVPLWENADAGIRVPYSRLPDAWPTSENGSLLYRRSRRRSVSLRIEACAVRQPDGQRKRIYNPWGLKLCFLRGDVVEGRIGVRHDNVPYVTKRDVAPNWEWRPLGHILPGEFDAAFERPSDDWMGFDRSRLNDAIQLNFFG